MKISHIGFACCITGISGLINEFQVRESVGEFVEFEEELNIDSNNHGKIGYHLISGLKIFDILTTLMCLKYLLVCGLLAFLNKLVLVYLFFLLHLKHPTSIATATATAPAQPKLCRVQLFQESIIWDDAVSFCTSRGLSLVTVESEEKYNCVLSKINDAGFPDSTSYWTAGTITGPGSRDFIWTTNGQIVRVFYPVGTGQPDNAGGMENCIEMRTDASVMLPNNRFMNDIPCTVQNSVLCE